ncbi:hypothetical protein EYF80_002440 [Liparis tanakae]|uniref:Uncharacterized protein n=1 Tax=Liparis tanakae TaxID=230148 RepID=A0A4Z2JC83_9TELE|nr:hypothetical protein EYF80_002440 [Liparis tanakae]
MGQGQTTLQPLCLTLMKKTLLRYRGDAAVVHSPALIAVPHGSQRGVILVDSVHVDDRTGFEDGVELDRHAETTKHHVSVAVLGSERLVVSKSVKQSSEPLVVIRISPLRVKIMDLSSMLIIQPTTSPACQHRPNKRLPVFRQWPYVQFTSITSNTQEQLTLYPSKTKASSSVPSSTSGLQPGLAQPTLMSPPVTASNSKYHFPLFTAYVLSTLKKRILSMLSRSTTCPTGDSHSVRVRMASRRLSRFDFLVRSSSRT